MKKSFLFTLSFSFFLISGGYGMAQESQTDSAAGSENTDTWTSEKRLPPPPPKDFNENDDEEFRQPSPPPRDFNENGDEEFRQPPPPPPADNNGERFSQTADDQSRNFTEDRRDDTNEFSGRHHGRGHDRPPRRHRHENRQD